MDGIERIAGTPHRHQVNINIDAELWRAMKLKAAAQGLTLTAVIARLCLYWIGGNPAAVLGKLDETAAKYPKPYNPPAFMAIDERNQPQEK